jgi:hypothetical protein
MKKDRLAIGLPLLIHDTHLLVFVNRWDDELLGDAVSTSSDPQVLTRSA